MTHAPFMSVMLLVTWAGCEPEPPAPSSTARVVNPTGRTAVQQEAQRAAEQRCRAAYFEFELTDVDEIHGGDWVAFYERKVAEDREFAAIWTPSERTPLAQRGPGQVRGHRALELEFDRVVMPEAFTAQDLANEVAAALLAGDVTSVARDCVMFGSTPAAAERCEE